MRTCIYTQVGSKELLGWKYCHISLWEIVRAIGQTIKIMFR